MLVLGLMILGFWTLFHTFQIQTQILANDANSGEIRAATIGVLSIVFALGEPVVGRISQSDVAFDLMLVCRSALGVVIYLAWHILTPSVKSDV